MPGKRAEGKTARNIAIPDDIYAACATRAAAAGTTVSAVVNDALARYAAGDDTPTPAPTGPHVHTVLELGTGEHAGQVVFVRRIYDRTRTRRGAVVLAEHVLAVWTPAEAAEQIAAPLFGLLLLAAGDDQPG